MHILSEVDVKGHDSTPPRAKPEGNIKLIPLHPEDEDKCVHIGAELLPKQKLKLLAGLRANEDIFAWSPNDLQVCQES